MILADCCILLSPNMRNWNNRESQVIGLTVSLNHFLKERLRKWISPIEILLRAFFVQTIVYPAVQGSRDLPSQVERSFWLFYCYDAIHSLEEKHVLLPSKHTKETSTPEEDSVRQSGITVKRKRDNPKVSGKKKWQIQLALRISKLYHH